MRGIQMKKLLSKESGIVLDAKDKESPNKVTKHVGLFIDCKEGIGRKVRFINWEPGMGTMARDYTFTIVGHQRTYGGRLAYRVLCDNGWDDFGRPAHYDEVEFVD
jgi:hypothetical protein